MNHNLFVIMWYTYLPRLLVNLGSKFSGGSEHQPKRILLTTSCIAGLGNKTRSVTHEHKYTYATSQHKAAQDTLPQVYKYIFI